MSLTKAVIAVAGWEERFLLGSESDISVYRPAFFLCVVFAEFQAETRANRLHVQNACANQDIQYVEVEVRRSSPVYVWTKLREVFLVDEFRGAQVVVDITTMPREVIWWSFGSLQAACAQVSYVYHTPGKYAPGWVTRDTDQPRLVYQSSGVSDFGRDTCLVLISGFDTDRAAQLIQFFEPTLTLIGTQTGEQFENQKANVERHKISLRPSPKLVYFNVDAYGPDHGLSSLEEATATVRLGYNIVLASLGPKLSAVSLYHLQKRHDSLALAYAPSRQFNPEYSKGIGHAITGTLLHGPPSL